MNVGGAGKFIIRGTRLETDKELAQRQRYHDKERISRHIKQAKRTEKELRLLKELQTKYDNHIKNNTKECV